MTREILGRGFWAAFLLALACRAGYFAYNEWVNADSIWTWQGRAALHAAKQFTGDTSPTPGVSDEGAEFMFVNGVNGQTYLHLGLAWLCGKTSYTHMQLLQLAADTLLIFPITFIGLLLGGRALGLLAAVVHACFLPECWLALVPGYDFWASFGFISSTALFLWAWQRPSQQTGVALRWFFLGAVVAGLAACARPTVLFYPALWAGLLLFWDRSWPLKGMAAAGLLAGLFIGYLPVLAHNHYIHGAVTRAPSVSIHQFWCGIGQYPNPYGVKDDDGSIARFYKGLTGKPGPLYQYSPDYVAVLKREAGAYLQTHPFHYLGCVARRGLLFLSGVGLRQARLDADIWKEHRAILDRREIKDQLVREHGSVLGVLWYLARYPQLYVWYPLLLLPLLGMLGALCWERRAVVFLAAAPLLYSLLVFTPFYYCERCVISAYAATIPVWALGLMHWYTWARARGRGRPCSRRSPSFPGLCT